MSDYRYRTISFLSDYGLVDEFVGVCHGVMLRIAPEVTVVDVCHGGLFFRLFFGGRLFGDLDLDVPNIHVDLRHFALKASHSPLEFAHVLARLVDHTTNMAQVLEHEIVRLRHAILRNLTAPL